MAVNKGEIGIYGILRRDGGDNILAKTDQIQDDDLQKTQKQLNQEAVNGAALATAHIANTNNPHSVTKAQVGLDKVTNDEQVKRTEMGKPLGVATLDGLGKVPSSQLPAYVDDVVEYETVDSFPKYGESGKIYVETTTNLTYRWTGTQYIEISKSIGLGETESTAYPGDKGKQVADNLDSHIKDTTNPHNVTKEQLGLGNVDNTADSEKNVNSVKKAFTCMQFDSSYKYAKLFTFSFNGIKNRFRVKLTGIGDFIDISCTFDVKWNWQSGSVLDVQLLLLEYSGIKNVFLHREGDKSFSVYLYLDGTNSVINAFIYYNQYITLASNNISSETEFDISKDVLPSKSTLEINSLSATKLQTSRTIWGQSFDGSKDIDGPFRCQNITISNNNEIDCTYGSHNLSLNYRSSGNVNIAQGGGITTVGPLRPSMQDNCTLNVHGSMKAVSYKLEDSTEYAESVTDTEVETMLNDLGI